MTHTEVVQIARCDRCDARLVVAGPPAELGGSAVFSVRCSRCGARVPLASALAGVTSVSLAPDEPEK